MSSRTIAVVLALGSLDPCSKLTALMGQQTSTTSASAAATTVMVPAPPPLTPEEAAIAEAKQLCARGDCQSAHERLAVTIPPGSPLRQGAEFRGLENKWAASTVSDAANDPDILARRRALEDVMKSAEVDANYKTRAKAALATLPKEPPPPLTSLDGGTQTTDFEVAKKLKDKDPSAAKALLLPRVQAGISFKEERDLLLTICKKQKDVACVTLVKAAPQTPPTRTGPSGP